MHDVLCAQIRDDRGKLRKPLCSNHPAALSRIRAPNLSARPCFLEPEARTLKGTRRLFPADVSAKFLKILSRGGKDCGGYLVIANKDYSGRSCIAGVTHLSLEGVPETIRIDFSFYLYIFYLEFYF